MASTRAAFKFLLRQWSWHSGVHAYIACKGCGIVEITYYIFRWRKTHPWVSPYVIMYTCTRTRTAHILFSVYLFRVDFSFPYRSTFCKIIVVKIKIPRHIAAAHTSVCFVRAACAPACKWSRFTPCRIPCVD